MTRPGEAPEADMLPGLRASVADAKVKAAATRARKAAAWQPAAVDPVVSVILDVALPHLDRPFDYTVPEAMSGAAVPGARVKVRFAGQEAGGFIVARGAASDHVGRLQPLRRVVSPEPVLSPEIADVSAVIARRYAGVRSDVLRLAVPPRHATAEKAASPVPMGAAGEGDPTLWRSVAHGESFLSHLRAARSPRAVWTAAPGDDWPAMLAVAAARTLASGRGTVLCVPDQRDVTRVSAALTRVLGEGHHAVLTAEGGPAARYTEFLAVARGSRQVVVGTRSAALAPVRDLGLVVIWDDGDDLHAEPRAPYPHVREILRARAERSGAAMLVGGFACTPEARHLLASGFAHHLSTPRDVIRGRVRVAVAPAEDRAVATRLPGPAVAAIKRGLLSGPVLVQTPRAGYAAALACERCRTPARCSTCSGPLVLTGPAAPPQCRWCGTSEPAWACTHCGHRGLRAPMLGEARTAEELGRTFPGTTVRSSSGERVLTTVPDAAAIVVATVGAEPVAESGYACVLLLDTWLTLGREDLRVTEEALRRWMGAAGLLRPGGDVVAVGDPAHPALQALVRWDPLGLAEREWEERAQAHLPPTARLATITGGPGALDDAMTLLRLPEHAEVLGPVEVRDRQHRIVVRVPLSEGDDLLDALAELQRVRSSRKLDPVRIQVDPLEL